MTSIPLSTDVPPAQRGRLLRVLGLASGLAVVVGRTIGVSIFRLPGSIAALLGSAPLVIAVWSPGGLYTLLSANYMSELAAMLPKAGGPYVYAHRALLVISIAFFVGYILSDTRNSLFALGVLGLSYPLFRLTRPQVPNGVG